MPGDRPFGAMFEALVEKYERLWWSLPSSAQPPEEPVDRRRQRANEREYRRGLAAAASALRHARTEEDLLAREAALRAVARRYMTPALPSGAEDEFARVAREFIVAARAFDPDLPGEDIAQALRNVWIANSLQIYLGAEVRLTPAITAYSLLYPYTDNLLDDPAVPAEKKNRSILALRRRLAGEAVPAENRYAERLSALVARIEEQYPRAAHPDLYQSLLAIHRAQELSLAQHGPGGSPYETNLLQISLRKGGASVLADGYLVRGDLAAEEAGFFFGFGVVLQFIDDLQDLAADRRRGHWTIFSQTAGRWPLDGLTNRLFRLSAAFLADGRFDEARGEALRDLLLRSCKALILEGAALHERFYTRAYLRILDSRSPVRLAAVQALRRKAVRLARRTGRGLTPGRGAASGGSANPAMRQGPSG